MINFPDTPTPGQIFVSGSSTWKWDGTKWAPIPGGSGGGAGGDITAVLAGTGLNGGGTTGDVTLNLTVPVTVVDGGTGATSASAALVNLGGAPLDSPVFTGNPTGPTPPIGDNDTSLATTSFVTVAIAAAGSGSGGGGIPEAPLDGITYGRQMASWTHVLMATGDVVDGGNF